jgi:hypothetical protein
MYTMEHWGEIESLVAQAQGDVPGTSKCSALLVQLAANREVPRSHGIVWPAWSLRGRSDVRDPERMDPDGAGTPSSSPGATTAKNVNLVAMTSADARRQVRRCDVWTGRSLYSAWDSSFSSSTSDS